MFLTGNRLDDLEVHLSTRPDVGDLISELGPMPLFTAIALRTAPQASSDTPFSKPAVDRTLGVLRFF